MYILERTKCKRKSKDNLETCCGTNMDSTAWNVVQYFLHSPNEQLHIRTARTFFLVDRVDKPFQWVTYNKERCFGGILLSTSITIVAIPRPFVLYAQTTRSIAYGLFAFVSPLSLNFLEPECFAIILGLSHPNGLSDIDMIIGAETRKIVCIDLSSGCFFINRSRCTWF